VLQLYPLVYLPFFQVFIVVKYFGGGMTSGDLSFFLEITLVGIY
jgi:hypothetical protein